MCAGMPGTVSVTGERCCGHGGRERKGCFSMIRHKPNHFAALFRSNFSDQRAAATRGLPCDRATPICKFMPLKNRTAGTIRTLLRIGFAILLAVILFIPHTSMAQTQQSQTMVMLHIGKADGAVNHGNGPHERMNGSLCATICAGTTAFESIAFSGRHIAFGPVRWRVETALARVQPTPDPALRPPDLLRYA